MNKFSLLEESWIRVIVDDNGSVDEVSLINLFKNAHIYKRLAGETEAQNFAILRFLLAIMYTVFTRFDAEGTKYEYLDLDEKFIPLSDIRSDDENDYLDALYSTWKKLWEKVELPDIIETYLKKWADRFNLFDDQYPFYQVTEKDLKTKNVVKTGEIQFQLVNRLISESNHKPALFAPTSKKYKNDLSNSELARWLIAFQGYTGTADKAKFPEMKASASKGWLLGLGSVYLKGKNLKQTFLLNLIMDAEYNNIIEYQFLKKQEPMWEKDFDQIINDSLYKLPSNLAELYTNYSRLIMLKENKEILKSFIAVQLPKLDDKNFLLEPMTMWKKNIEKGTKKNIIAPRTHIINQSFWRSFGQVTLNDASHIKPHLLHWHKKITDDDLIKEKLITLVAVGLDYNRDASTMINNLIYDELNINNHVLADTDNEQKDAWIIRISEQVEWTKKIIHIAVKGFAEDIVTIRNLSDNHSFIDKIVQETYFRIDVPFREWLAGIKINDGKEDKIALWKKNLKKILLEYVQDILHNAGKRDFLGGTHNEKYINIEIAYNKFLYRLNM